jgi:bifunctional non-homologous end joining protein LigD
VAKLEKYREMRDFEATPEPSGDEPEPAPGAAPRFVVQEHHATALHWDLRLERDGVLASWAVPKGIPPDPRVNHLAVQTEDHPLMYLDFHGEIPEGEYGAGQMTVWDTGTYDLHEWTDKKVEATFHGERAKGLYVLFRTRGNQWMIHRKDPPEDPTRELMPKDLRPMIASAGKLPKDEENWGFEVHWDGVRTLVASDGGRLELTGADGEAIGVEKTPELRLMGRQLGAVEVILDGELVAFDDTGRPDPERLERRMALDKDSAIRRTAKSVPITFVAYDLIWMEGHATIDLPYTERRKLLEELKVTGPNWQTPAYHRGEGKALLEAANQQGLTGVVAKRLDSTYQPGTTTKDWREITASSTNKP